MEESEEMPEQWMSWEAWRVKQLAGKGRPYCKSHIQASCKPLEVDFQCKVCYQEDEQEAKAKAEKEGSLPPNADE